MGSHGNYSQSGLAIGTDTVAFVIRDFSFAPRICLSDAILQLFCCLANKRIKLNSLACN